MIEVSLRMKKDDSCPEDLVKSITTCLEQTLSYSHNRLNQMDQLKKLRNMETVRQFELYCWLTEVGTNFYFQDKDHLLARKLYLCHWTSNEKFEGPAG